MLVNFFQGLRDAGVPVTTRELLDLMEGLKRNVTFADMDEFYFFSRTCMVKDEKYFDRFDKAFGAHFKELEALDDIIEALIPDDWLRSEFMKNLTDEEVVEFATTVPNSGVYFGAPAYAGFMKQPRTIALQFDYRF